MVQADAKKRQDEKGDKNHNRNGACHDDSNAQSKVKERDKTDDQNSLAEISGKLLNFIVHAVRLKNDLFKFSTDGVGFLVVMENGAHLFSKCEGIAPFTHRNG